MLTELQRERCRRIAEALDRGETVSLDSLSPEERGEVWDSRAHVRAMYERRRQREAAQVSQNLSPIGLKPQDEALARDLDLDFWAVDDEPDDEDDDDAQLCSACHGTGRDVAGNVCWVCHGTGKVLNEGDEDDDDEREDEED